MANAVGWREISEHLKLKRLVCNELVAKNSQHPEGQGAMSIAVNVEVKDFVDAAMDSKSDMFDGKINAKFELSASRDDEPVFSILAVVGGHWEATGSLADKLKNHDAQVDALSYIIDRHYDFIRPLLEFQLRTMSIKLPDGMPLSIMNDWDAFGKLVEANRERPKKRGKAKRPAS